MKHYCVITHTHWDREWYLTFEQFRLKLVDLMDHLLTILEQNEDYVFHLDAQTIVLEDYWQIKPEKKELCCHFIQNGQLIVGPWYVQNDFLLTSGEATVRNLLLGRKQALEAGACGDSGYAPDQFGMISQLPQILRGFGIDNCVFGRGYRSYSIDGNGNLVEQVLPSEMRWRSPDGSEVLGICMSFWYNNAQRFSADPERAMRLVKLQDKHFEGIAQTPYLLLMNGVDHLEPQEDLLPILTDLQKRLPEGDRIYQTTFQNYLRMVQDYLSDRELFVWNGEMVSGVDAQLLKDCSSTRVYIKTKNVTLQNLLESKLEPLYAMLEMSGMEGAYPTGHLDYLWKKLICNHAHDSICGCSKDAVQRHVEDRFASIEEACRDLQIRGMELLSAHIGRDSLDQKDYLITVVNTLEKPRTECVELTVDVLTTDTPSGLRILDENENEMPFTLLSHKRVNRRMISSINLPGFREVERYRIRMLAEDVPAFGYRIFRVQTNGTCKEAYAPQKATAMENPWLRVEVDSDGNVDLLHKASGYWYRDILQFEDRADIGHSYISMQPAEDMPLKLTNRPVITANCGDIRQTITLDYQWELPACYDEANACRSGATVACPLQIQLVLDAQSQRLDVELKLENRAKDHRLLALIKTGLSSNQTAALSPYDLVRHDKAKIDTRICNETRHNSGCVSICNGDLGMTLLNHGLFAYENLQREEGTLSLTLVRSTGRVWALDSEGAPEDDSWEAPENQCLRNLELRLSLYPHGSDLEQAQILFAQRAFQNPLLVHSSPVDTRKFLGGRPALQDADIDENFYQSDPYPQTRLPRCGGMFRLDGQFIQVTAWKKSYDRKAYVLRFFSGSEQPQIVKLSRGYLNVRKLYQSNLDESERNPIDFENGTALIAVGAKEIVTLILEV